VESYLFRNIDFPASPSSSSRLNTASVTYDLTPVWVRAPRSPITNWAPFLSPSATHRKMPIVQKAPEGDTEAYILECVKFVSHLAIISKKEKLDSEAVISGKALSLVILELDT